MQPVLPSRIADAQLAEKDAWKRYAAAKGDNWRVAFDEWAQAREAVLETYLDEAARWPSITVAFSFDF
jgi:hypothetical protein